MLELAPTISAVPHMTSGLNNFLEGVPGRRRQQQRVILGRTTKCGVMLWTSYNDIATFDTTSDTEVVLEAWRKWGPACLEQLWEIYALTIYDSRTAETFIARDPFGIEPLLYYPTQDGGQAFASELKTPEAYNPDKFSLNSDAVLASIMYVWINVLSLRLNYWNWLLMTSNVRCRAG